MKNAAIVTTELAELPDNTFFLAVSKDATRWAYLLVDRATGKKPTMVATVSGRTERRTTAETFGAVGFLPDGRLYFSERTGGAWRYVIGSAAEPPYANLGNIVFSGDGRRFAYPVMTEKDVWAVVRDGALEGGRYAGARALALSVGGEHLAFVAKDSAGERVVHDGTNAKVVKRVDGLVLGPRGELLWAAEVEPGTYGVFLGEELLAEGEDLGGYGFTTTGVPYYVTAVDDEAVLVVGGSRAPLVGLATHVVFDGAGALAAYAYEADDESCIVYASGADTSSVPAVATLVASKSGRVVAATLDVVDETDDEMEAAFCRGERSPGYDGIYHLAVTDDDAALTFVSARHGGALAVERLAVPR